jgi:hypothetical protein
MMLICVGSIPRADGDSQPSDAKSARAEQCFRACDQRFQPGLWPVFPARPAVKLGFHPEFLEIE